MICEKCGKNNQTGAEHCTFCGAKMPVIPYGTGFADILRFSSQQSGMAETAGQSQTGESQELRKRLAESRKREQLLIKRLRTMTILTVILLLLAAFLTISLLKRHSAEMTREETPTPPAAEEMLQASADGQDDKKLTEDDVPVIVDDEAGSEPPTLTDVSADDRAQTGENGVPPQEGQTAESDTKQDTVPEKTDDADADHQMAEGNKDGQ